MGSPMPKYEYKYIPVKVETYEKVLSLKGKYGFRSFDELVNMLLGEFSKCVELQTRDRVRKVMCNKFRESSATLPAWFKLLTKELNDVDSIINAIEYLKPNPQKPDEYVVDTSKCVEG